MKKFIALSLLAIFCNKVSSQELYVFSEPASNMPSKSVTLKGTGRFPITNSFKNRYMPEIMIGINKSWMVHLTTTFSNYYSSNTRLESGKVYAKYRFYSNDDVHKHFRMAAFADVALTRNPYVFDDINFEGDHKGMQGGIIATQLVNKLAVSGTVAYTRLFPTTKAEMHHGAPTLAALNYSLSAGYLVLPKEYVDYNQTNFNVYFEILGMRSIDQQHYGVDFAPAVQLIFNSNSKVNLGYRFQVAGNMYRMSNQMVQLSFEHTLFNAWK